MLHSELLNDCSFAHLHKLLHSKYCRSSNNAINTIRTSIDFSTSWSKLCHHCVSLACRWTIDGVYCYYDPLNVYTRRPSLSARRIRQKPKGNIHTSGLMTIYIIDNTLTHSHIQTHGQLCGYDCNQGVNTHSAFFRMAALIWNAVHVEWCSHANKHHGNDIESVFSALFKRFNAKIMKNPTVLITFQHLCASFLPPFSCNNISYFITFSLVFHAHFYVSPSFRASFLHDLSSSPS